MPRTAKGKRYVKLKKPNEKNSLLFSTFGWGHIAIREPSGKIRRVIPIKREEDIDFEAQKEHAKMVQEVMPQIAEELLPEAEGGVVAFEVPPVDYGKTTSRVDLLELYRALAGESESKTVNSTFLQQNVQTFLKGRGAGLKRDLTFSIHITAKKLIREGYIKPGEMPSKEVIKTLKSKEVREKLRNGILEKLHPLESLVLKNANKEIDRQVMKAIKNLPRMRRPPGALSRISSFFSDR
jgi:hypothetical protein